MRKSSTTSPNFSAATVRTRPPRSFPTNWSTTPRSSGNLDYVKEQIKAWEASGVTMMVVGARSVEQIKDLAALV